MTTEIVYLDHNNVIDLILKKRVPPTKSATAQPLDAVTKMTLTVGGVFIDSDDSSAPIVWGESSQDVGEIRIKIGKREIDAGNYTECPIVVYDSSNPDGLVWDHINIDVIADQEGS